MKARHLASHLALGCGLAFSVALIPAVGAPVLMIVPGVPSAEVGASFSVDVRMEDVQDLYAFNFSLSYNSAVLSLFAIDEGPFLSTAGSTFFIPGTIDNVAGLASFTGDSLLGMIPGATGSGVLATFTFRGIGTGTSALSLSETQALDSAFANIVTTTQGAQILITPSLGVSEPTSLPLVAMALLVCLTASRARRYGMAKAGSASPDRGRY